ncbi:hypothetical protein [Paracoccus albus]|nr:hypothetical protein [Paracoccus albus]WBU58998.1 hypothetical protein PAF20_09250 [Paracoccus albus]
MPSRLCDLRGIILPPLPAARENVYADYIQDMDAIFTPVIRRIGARLQLW